MAAGAAAVMYGARVLPGTAPYTEFGPGSRFGRLGGQLQGDTVILVTHDSRGAEGSTRPSAGSCTPSAA